MDPEESRVSLRLENERLRRENDDLQLILGLMKENQELRSKLYATDASVDHGPSVPLQGSKVKAVSWDETLEEGRFTDDLLKVPFRTSSPLDTSINRKSSPLETSVNRKSALKGPCLDPEQQQSDSQQVEERMVGEVAFQLDRRILAHVFQEQKRLYGFTVQNIPSKITQVSTHPVTGKVDESVHARLSERHLEVMRGLGRLGYRAALHPALAELVVNTYGVLRERPDQRSAQRATYGSPEALRNIVVDTVPPALLKDVLLLLSCLCYLAKQDGKALFLW
ncbi:hypothetical protein ACEWY4_019354 [Coilia grayii]|uniref:Speriolin C-terminal domain-containing protein n=1 Tax=Coilia grayii TaxID=363190 RepID=A0ABD1JAT5_9TELE